MKTPTPTPQEVMLSVPAEFSNCLPPRSWLSVSKSLLGWAMCTLRLAVREADAFFQIYKHAREDNKKLRKILAEHNIEVPPYDWRHDQDLIIQSHTDVPMGLWGYDDVEDSMDCEVDDLLGPITLTIRTPKQLAVTAEQTSLLSSTMDMIRDEFYSRDIEEGGWRVKQPAEVKRRMDF